MSQLPPSTLSFTTSTSMPAQVSNMAAAPMASAATVPAAAAPLPAAAPTFLAGVSSVMQSSSMLPITHPPAQHLVSQKRIQDLVTSVAGPGHRLEPEAEELLLELADEFVESVSSFACLLAKHRQSNTLEVQDVQLHLEKNWNMHIPGFAVPESLASTPPVMTAGAPSTTLGPASGFAIKNIRKPHLFGISEAHRRRLALVQKVEKREMRRATNSQHAATVGDATATSAAATAEDDDAMAASAPAKGGGVGASSHAAKKRRRNIDESEVTA